MHMLKRFSVGEVTAHEVRVAAGDPTVTTIAWTGPDCATQFCAAYVTGEVKCRGENRLSNDLLIKVDGGVAPLGRAQLRGRCVSASWKTNSPLCLSSALAFFRHMCLSVVVI